MLEIEKHNPTNRPRVIELFSTSGTAHNHYRNHHTEMYLHSVQSSLNMFVGAVVHYGVCYHCSHVPRNCNQRKLLLFEYLTLTSTIPRDRGPILERYRLHHRNNGPAVFPLFCCFLNYLESIHTDIMYSSDPGLPRSVGLLCYYRTYVCRS